MPLDWFAKTGPSESVADLVAKKKYAKALEKLRAEFQKGNRSVGLRLQYADVLAKSDATELAIPVLLGLASELFAAGAPDRAQDVLEEAALLGPGRADVAAKRRSFAAQAREKDAEPRAGTARRATPPPALASAEPVDDSRDAGGAWSTEGMPAQGRDHARDGLAAGEGSEGGNRLVGQGPERDSENDAIDLFAPALTPPRFATPVPAAAEVGAALAQAEATVASEVWVDVEGEAVDEVIVAEVASDPSIADIAEMAVADGHSDEDSLVAYIRDLAARLPLPADERAGGLHLAAALFAGLSDDELSAQLPGLNRHDFDPGAAMVREDDRGESLFILARGRARVYVSGAHGRAFEVAELPQGSFFGEISMVGGLRTATVEALGPCETLEVASAVIEALARERPLVQQILEDVLLERASSAEVEAVKAIPGMDAETPSRALTLFDAHFGLSDWTPKTRMRLADLLVRAGHYVDVVPVLVGVADQMQAAGQPARALAVVGKLTSLGVRASRELRMTPLLREPATPRPGPPDVILTYVAQGRPAPPPKASQQFGLWLQELMGEARADGADDQGTGGQGAEPDEADRDLIDAIESDEAAARLARELEAKP